MNSEKSNTTLVLRDIVTLVLVAFVIVGFVVYKKQASEPMNEERSVVEEPVANDQGEVEGQFREIAANASFTAPSGDHIDRFSLFLDANGEVRGVKVTDTLEPGSAHEKHLAEFSEGLLIKIKGMKLSEIEPVDRIGSSSLTTTAFNNALAELKTL